MRIDMLFSKLAWLLVFSLFTSTSNGWQQSEWSALNISCKIDHQLETLVRKNSTHSQLYVLHHDATSKQVAREFIYCKEQWMETIMLNKSPFFESSVYRDFFSTHESEWRIKNISYVITTTYKSVQSGEVPMGKSGYLQLDLNEIKKMLAIAYEGDYDFVPFMRCDMGLMRFAMKVHGQPFKVAWDALLLKLGYNETTIRKYDEAKAFYRNIFIAKPAILLKLSDLMRRAMTIVKEDKHLVELFEVDSKYEGGNEEVAMRMFGTTYYQLHPFIFERLPVFFLYEMGAKVCINEPKMGPCSFNYIVKVHHRSSNSTTSVPHKQSHSSASVPHKQSHSSASVPHKQSHSSASVPHKQSHSSASVPHKQSHSSASVPHKQSHSSARVHHKQSHSSASVPHNPDH